jgi:hypothetical protein
VEQTDIQVVTATWSFPVTLTVLAASMVVNALVTGLIVNTLRILNVQDPQGVLGRKADSFKLKRVVRLLSSFPSSSRLSKLTLN